MRSRTEGAFASTTGCITTALFLPSGRICTEASWSRRVVPLALAEAAGHIQDAEFSACCTAAASIRARASSCILRPLGIEGSGIARSRIATAVSFWLALFRASGLSTSSSARIHFRVIHPASRAPAPRPVHSCSSATRSFYVCRRSSSSLASSSWCCASCACCIPEFAEVAGLNAAGTTGGAFASSFSASSLCSPSSTMKHSRVGS